MKVGTILIAISECYMELSKSKALTPGKAYIVESVENNIIRIIDNDKIPHTFDLNGIHSYKRFFIKESRLIRLERVANVKFYNN